MSSVAGSRRGLLQCPRKWLYCCSSQRRQPTNRGCCSACCQRGAARALRVTSAPIPAGSPRAIASGPLLGLDGAWLTVAVAMLRWLLLLGIGFGLVTGVSKGWIELRWGRLLQDLGVPYVVDPGASAAGCRSGAEDAPASSAREARSPSR